MSHQFVLTHHEVISDTHVEVRIYRHPSGATFVSVQNDDENKSFGVTFRTMPATSNGVAHILEHSVLCGSTRFPVKSPFNELLKGSLNTFLNAMTYPDKTVYPVASTNRQDLYNLVDVYMDAVFHPLISEDTLRQEGWRYEFDEHGVLTYKGIVYNEMKGASATAERVTYRALMRELLPDTIYANDSGGDPLVIPSLTYADFVAFHQTYYHPSNALIYWYGDDDIEARLAHLEPYLASFHAQAPPPALQPQPHWTQPRRATAFYPATHEETRHHVNVAWLIDAPYTSVDAMEIATVNDILLSTAVAPLQKYLRDSNLGEDLSGGGFGNTQQLYFALGLKGVQREDIDRVIETVQNAIQSVIANGVDQDQILASLNRIEFRYRELDFGSMPRGLGIMLALCDDWIYGRDILDSFRYEADLRAVKQRLADPTRIPTLLTTMLQRNPHKLELIVAPDATLNDTVAALERDTLAAIDATLDDTHRAQIRHEADALRLKQSAPDDPADLRKLPRLTRHDIDEHASDTPLVHELIAGVPVSFAPLQTNGIAYVEVAYNLAFLPAALLQYLPIYTKALSSIGAGPFDAIQFTQQIGIHTGGIEPSMIWGTHRLSNETNGHLVLRGRATADTIPMLLTLIGHMANTPHLHNRERILQIIKEDKASREARLLPSGHIAINTRLRARYTTTANINEQLGGINYLQFVRNLATDAESTWTHISQSLSAVQAAVFGRNGLRIHVTCSEALIPQICTALADFVAHTPTTTAVVQPWNQLSVPLNEALQATAPVNYVGVATSLTALGYTPNGADIVVNRHLSRTFLHEEIREKGGAYGAFSVLDVRSGVVSMLSYRDPNITQTFDVYAQAGAWLQSLQLDEETLLQAIIGAAGDLDSYMLPVSRGFTAFTEYLNGVDHAYRQTIRDQALHVTNADFVRYGEVLARAATKWNRIVLGGETAITQAQTSHAGLFDTTTKVQ